MRKTLITALTVALFAIIVNGCGGGSDEPEVNGTHSQNAPIEKLDPTKLHPEFD